MTACAPLPHERLAEPARWVYLLWVYGALALSVFLVGVTGWPRGAELVTMWVAVGLAALWLPWMPDVARRGRNSWQVTGYYVVLAVLGAVLLGINPQFSPFASVEFSFSFVLFEARAALLAAGLTAVLNLAVQTEWLTKEVPPYAAILGVVVPLGVGGWLLGQEAERRRRTVLELRQALAENEGLHNQLLTQAREAGVREERERLAREVHDTVAQGLTGIIAQLNAADRTSPDARQAHLAQVRALASSSLAEARRAVQALRPEALEDSHLPEALQDLATHWSHTSGLTPEVEVTGAPTRLATDVEVALYRVAQESLTNIAKHANATRTVLTLSYEDEAVLLDVVDNGEGFDPEESTVDGYGLSVMRQRLESVGGTLTVEATRNQGTAISAVIPR
ncbi:signal transduction histidine kinase [Crossiella equi]|uniref:Oxygen sensor histidine kinase NreB n=1 Tax=Crossiella equi TaxID=130796 RepID=A0ABS5ALI0_9PSEU|nr:sensor histidine kinase [Crossiella equi]MBP2477413.1 signal transduction histidine kinase [Crossiella equi]